MYNLHHRIYDLPPLLHHRRHAGAILWRPYIDIRILIHTLHMTSLLYSIIVAALLSVTSLIAVLLRVSPLLSPAPALAAFFASLFLSITTVMTLLLYALWKWFPLHAWDDGKTIGIALRQGVFLGIIAVLIVLLHLLGILTWWIALLVILVFILVEVALQS